MNKVLRVAGFCAGFVLLMGTTAEACTREAAQEGPEAARVAINFGHDHSETLSGSELQGLLNRARLSESLHDAINEINESEVPDEVRNATKKLATNIAEDTILSACAQEGLPSGPSPPLDPDAAVTSEVASDLQAAVQNGGGDELAADAVCQAAVDATSPH